MTTPHLPKSKSIVPHPLSDVTPEAEPEPEVEVEPVRQRAGYLLVKSVPVLLPQSQFEDNVSFSPELSLITEIVSRFVVAL